MAAVDPEHALLIAAALHQGRRLPEGEAMCRRILEGNPRHAGAWHRLGLIAVDGGRLADAADALGSAVGFAPGEARIHCDLGLVHRLAGRMEEAVASFRRAIALDPGCSEAHLNLGDTLTGLGCFDEAVCSCMEAARLRPNDPLAHNNLGNALRAAGRADEAIAAYRRAIALQPHYAEAWSNAGLALADLRRWDEAIANHEHAISLRPDLPELHANLGSARTEKGEYDRAIACFRRALSCCPDFAPAHSSLGLLLLLRGQYEEGWREYEWRRDGQSPGAPTWDGGSMPGRTLLVCAEQGLGDAIHFMRYVPLLRERTGGARVIVACPHELERLWRESGSWNADIVADPAPTECDMQVRLMSLPWALGIHEPMAAPGPYLHVSTTRRAEWRERIGSRKGLRVGLAWRGSRRHATNDLRSIALEKLQPLFGIEGVDFYSLQVGEDIGHSPLIDFTASISDLADTAAFISELDLVISVDTAVAHLAGALGRPVWVLVPCVPDWRWGLERETSPWYPGMRLFRQAAAGDWESVVERVAGELRLVRR